MVRNIQAIIPAAGKPTNKILVNSTLPDTMLPINGKPVIGYIVEDLLERGINHAVIVLNEADNHTESYVKKKFGIKCTIDFIYQSNIQRGVGYSIYLASKKLKDGYGTLLYLGDTIYKGKLSFSKDFLVVSKNYDSADKWCFVEKTGSRLNYINKPDKYEGKGKVLSGLYFFKNNATLKKALKRAEANYQVIEVYHILDLYGPTFSLVEADGWYDCGNIENYYKAKIDFLKKRHFNRIYYDDLRGLITKSSDNRQKILDEISWYQNVPQELKIFSPRLIDFDVNKNNASYSLEFYGYQSLADLFVFNNLDLRLWHIIIDRLFGIIGLFKRYKSRLPLSFYDEMYCKKTKKRIEKLKASDYWRKLMGRNNININGRSCKNLDHFLPKIEAYLKRLYHSKEMSFIHGDLCLGNILFDPISRIFKFIDPRGSFGEPSIYGDVKYDLAKLRHSFAGSYDFIVSDLFRLEENNGNFDFQVFKDDYHEKIKEYFDQAVQKNRFNLNNVKFIEALLFLSMIPLHGDSKKRQVAMYLTGIKLLNDLNI